MSQISRALIAIGSNLENPVAQVCRAFDELGRLPDTYLSARSSLYRSEPIGKNDQPDFINAVVQIETALSPYNLLEALLEIEKDHGRMRDLPNDPRTLDLDILMYDELQCNENGLILPHPRMHKRAFVLKPLMEISRNYIIHGHGTVAELLLACTNQRVEREDNW